MWGALLETFERVGAFNRDGPSAEHGQQHVRTSAVEDFSDCTTNLASAIKLFGYGLDYMTQLEDACNLRFQTRHGSGREGLMSGENRKALRLQHTMMEKLLSELSEYAPEVFGRITLGAISSERNEHNNNLMMEKNELMTQIEYAMHQASIDQEYAKRVASDLGFCYFTRSHSSQAKRSQYRKVQRREQRMNPQAHQRIPYKGKVVRRPKETKKGIAKRLERTLGLAQNGISVVQAKKAMQMFCSQYGTPARQGTIRATTTKDNIGTLPHALAHNQDARAAGGVLSERD